MRIVPFLLVIFAVFIGTGIAQDLPPPQSASPLGTTAPANSPASPTPTEYPATVAPPASNSLLLANQDMLSDALTARVADRLQARQDYYWGIAVAIGAAFLGLFTFIGLGQVADIRKTVRESVLQDLRNELAGNPSFQDGVAARIRGTLLADMEAQNQRIQRDLKIVRLQVLSERVLTDERVDQNDRAALRDDLFSLASFPDVVGSPAYRRGLRNATDFFFQRGLGEEIDSLDDLLGEVIRNPGQFSRDGGDVASRIPMIRMMQHYGQRVIGGSHEVEPSQDTIKRFMRYANALKANRYFEESAHYIIAWEMLQKSSGWEGRVQAIWRDVAHFTDHEKADMFDNIEFLADIHRQSPRPSAVHHKLAAVFTDLKTTYADNVAPLQAAFEERKSRRQS